MTPERTARLLQVLQQRQTGLGVVLENVMDPHNISAVMRTCDAVGIQDLYILNTNIPVHNKFGFRSSRSASKWITPHQYEDPATCFEALRKQYDRILTTHLSSDAVGLYDIDFTGRVALVFGNEQIGVTEETRKLADGNFIIPQMGMIRSLNISVACAVSIYEAYRQKKLAGHYDQPSLSPERMATLQAEWGLTDQE